MGIDYTFSLFYGFEIPSEEAYAPFKKESKTPGSFHMEERFDPKTGLKVKKIKVWDEKPITSRWYEIDGKKYDDLDPEELSELLEDKFDCYVEEIGDYTSGNLSTVFYVNRRTLNCDDYGRVSIYNNELTADKLPELTEKALQLKIKMRRAGYKVGEPKIFIASRIC